MQDKFDIITSNWKVPSLLSKEEAWERVNSKISKESHSQQKEPRVLQLYSNKTLWVSMAASIALILSLVFLLEQDGQYTVETLNGEKEHIDLPDGSFAVLNSGSTLSFDKKNFEKNRTLHLTGEGFFQVEKGSTFSVLTDHGKVTVLGTSFNVCDRNGMYRVSCETGKVKVEQGTSSQFLTKGLKTERVEDMLSAPQACDIEAINDWFDSDIYHFENNSLSDVFQELERQFNVIIEAKDLSSDLVNADVSLKEITKALDIICSTFGLEYRSLSDDHFIIKKK